MSHLDVENRVYPTGFDDDPECEAQCLWFALCDNPANGVADAGPRGPCRSVSGAPTRSGSLSSSSAGSADLAWPRQPLGGTQWLYTST